MFSTRFFKIPYLSHVSRLAFAVSWSLSTSMRKPKIYCSPSPLNDASITSLLFFSFRKLSHNKTRGTSCIGSPAIIVRCRALTPTLNLGDSTIPYSECVKNRQVIFDSCLSFKDHIKFYEKVNDAFLRNPIHLFLPSHLQNCYPCICYFSP